MNPYSHPVSVLPNLPPSELTKVGHQLHVCIKEIYKNGKFRTFSDSDDMASYTEGVWL